MALIDLNGKTVLVTGAAGGFGQEFAKQLIRLGARLILTDAEEAGARETAKLAAGKKSATGGIIACIGADLSTAGGCEDLYRRAREAAPDLDLLINNAGIINYGLFHEIPPEKWEALMAVNLLAPMRLTHLFLPDMIRRGRGQIAFVCSVAGFIATPVAAPYSTSKFGMRGFALAVAAEAAPLGVDVSIVYPFYTNTPLLKSPAYGSVEPNPLPSMFNGTPRTVVRHAIRGIRRRRRQIYPDFYSRFSFYGSKLLTFTARQVR